MGNLEKPGHSAPGVENQAPTLETGSDQDFWDYKKFKLSPEKIGEIETLYKEYQDKKKTFETFEDQVRSVAKQIYASNSGESRRYSPPIYLDSLREVSLNSDGSVSAKEKRLESSIETGLKEWAPISPDEQISIIKSSLGERKNTFKPLIDKVEEINQQRRREPDNQDFDFWTEHVRLQGAIRESASKLHSVIGGLPSLTERPPLLDDPSFMEKIKGSLLSRELPQNHPFKTILKTEIMDIGPTFEDDFRQAEDDIKQILADAKIDFSDADAIRNNEEKRKNAFWEKLKILLSKDHLAPGIVRSQLRLIATTYMFEGGYKTIPGLDKLADPNSSIETFLKNIEEYLTERKNKKLNNI